MTFKYQLNDKDVEAVSKMEEFANGATQVTVLLKNGDVFSDVLISDSTYIIATRGYKDLPFNMSDIAKIYQTENDKNPSNRTGWFFWDDWQ